MCILFPMPSQCAPFQHVRPKRSPLGHPNQRRQLQGGDRSPTGTTDIPFPRVSELSTGNRKRLTDAMLVPVVFMKSYVPHLELLLGRTLLHIFHELLHLFTMTKPGGDSAGEDIPKVHSHAGYMLDILLSCGSAQAERLSECLPQMSAIACRGVDRP